ncbi:MAG: hypothetical protein ACI8RA_000863, partial [Chlamydiales bacterium]
MLILERCHYRGTEPFFPIPELKHGAIKREDHYRGLKKKSPIH